MTLDYKAIDVDNHYYEPIDALTRHLPKEFKRRGVQMVQDGKRTLAVMGERVNHFIPNPTFDPIIEPGCLDLLFRGEIPDGVDPASLMKVDRLADHPEYQNRDARVKVLDSQNLETVFMLPGEPYSYLSSKLVREIAQHGGPLNGLVPPVVEQRLRAKVS